MDNAILTYMSGESHEQSHLSVTGQDLTNTLNPISCTLADHATQNVRTLPANYLPYVLRNEPVIIPEGNDDLWDAMYQRFIQYVQQSGNTHLPSDDDPHGLKDWVNRQILNRRFLTTQQFEKLDKLGLNWATPLSRDHSWELMYDKLDTFRKKFGHCRVPSQWENDKQLALWVTRQRKLNLQGKIPVYRKHLLDTMEFTWQVQDLFDSQWETFFNELFLFQKQHGHCNVPGQQEKLVGWIERQRLARKRKALLPEREDRLNSIDFTWGFNELKKKSWDEKYKQLCAFRNKYGHSFVPVNFKDNKSLGTWVASQRKLAACGKLPITKLKKLDRLQFVWSGEALLRVKSGYDAKWEDSFKKLKAYQHLHGTCRVSLKSDPVLHSWTIWQRKMFLEGRITPERIARLSEISFPWNVNESYWMKMFGLLSAFYDTFGHTRVPSQWADNPRLAAWSYRLRANRHLLSPSQIGLLNQLGFEWTIKKKVIVGWPHMYRRLLAFKQEHGHTRVPVKWHKDPKLGKWVSRLRNEHQHVKAERRILLEAIEFEWTRRGTVISIPESLSL